MATKIPRKWSVEFNIGDAGDGHSRPIRRVIKFESVDAEAMAKVLRIIQTIFARVKNLKDRSTTVIALPSEPRKGEKYPTTADLIRPKYRYCNRRILRIKNPEVALVQGYGEMAQHAIQRG